MKTLESGRSFDQEIMARLRAFDLLATPFGEPTALDYYERYADDGGDAVGPRFAYMLDIATFGGYVFLGVQDGAPTVTYPGDNSASPRAAITMSEMRAGETNPEATEDVLGVVGVLHALRQRYAPEPVPQPKASGGPPQLRAINGGKV